MKKYFSLILIALLAIGAAAVERKQCIDSNWRFMLGDGSRAVSDPRAADSWRTLSLPHDWSVEPEAAAAAGGTVVGPFSTRSIGGFQTGFTVGGDGWYQKTLRLTADDLKGRTVLCFEGAYNQTTLWVNGRQCPENVYGYSSFRRDVSDLVQEGDNNILVHVANTGNNTRWYAGSGIYRHVWLVRTGRLRLDEWDTFVRSEDNRKVHLTATVRNGGTEAAKGRLRLRLLDAAGREAGTAVSKTMRLGAGEERDASASLTLEGARPWSPDDPYLYTAEISLLRADGSVADRLTKRIGLRTLEFSAEEGFRLNGKPMLIRGGCVHHDNGLLGAAAFDRAETRKLQRIKNLGYNAVRCSHNLPSEHFLDACDELGLMVVDECFDQWLIAKNPDDYSRYFREHSDEDIAVMVRRDRNHPSVIMWGIGNEIPGRISPEGMQTARRLREDILRLDPTRPVTAAICGWDDGDSWNAAGGNWEAQCDRAFQSLDIGGYNYLWDKYESDHRRAPERVMCGLESYPKQASENWTLAERLPYVVGDFVWTAMDYLGEAGIGAAYSDRQPPMFQPWPWFNGHCGDLDLTGQKKPQSYYRDVVWRERPVTMAVEPSSSRNNMWGWQLEEQHWTWTGREGQPLTVNVYSRAPRVRLYLNGKLLGEQTPGATFWTAFRVNYEPGTLRAVNLDAEGREAPGEDFTLETTGEAVGVRCIYENPTLTADEGDVAYVTLEVIDSQGRTVTSDCTTRLKVENIGAGELIGCATGAPDDMESFRSTTPRMFRGRAQAVVRSAGKAGAVELRVQRSSTCSSSSPAR